MLPIIGPIISALGSVATGFFNAKSKQGDAIVAGLKVVKDLANSNAEREGSAALVVAAEANSDSWLARNWRPATMIIFVGLIVARFFGLVPSHMSPIEYEKLWDLVELGMGGYVVSRSIEKIVAQLSLGGVLKKYLGQLTFHK